MAKCSLTEDDRAFVLSLARRLALDFGDKHELRTELVEELADKVNQVVIVCVETKLR